MKVFLKVLCIFLLWGLVAALIIFVDPHSVRDIAIPGTYLPLFALTGLAISYTLFVIFQQATASLVITALILLGLYLSISGIMNLFLGLVLTFMIIFSLYITKRR